MARMFAPELANMTVSEDSAAMVLGCGWICDDHFVASESSSERILKIDQCFAKLSTQVRCLVFLTYTV